MDRIELGELLKKQRRERGLTLADLRDRIQAEHQLDLSVNYLSSIERGGVLSPTLLRLRAIAKAYRLDASIATTVFYPDDAYLDQEAHVNQIFDSVIMDPMFKNESRERMLRGKLGMDTKIFIIKLFEKAKNKKVL